MSLDNAALVPQIPQFGPDTLSADSVVGLYGRTEVDDVNYNATNQDVYVGFKTLTAPRSVTLPSAASYTAGKSFVVVDESGDCADGKRITIAALGSDTIAGAASIDMGSPYQKLVFHSNGSSLWTI